MSASRDFPAPVNRAAVSLACVVLTLLALCHAAGLWHWPILQRLDNGIGDTRLHLAMPRSLDERIVIIDIDEQSLAEVGQWPWARSRIADLVVELTKRQKVSALGLDVVFAETERRTNPDPHSKTGSISFGLPIDGDRRLAQAVADGPVVLGYYFTSDRNGHRSGILPPPMAGFGSLPSLLSWSGYGANVGALASVAPAGFFNALTDADGLIRSVPLIAGFDGALYASMGLAMLQQGSAPRTLRIHPDESTRGFRSLELLGADGLLSIPLAPNGSVQVPYRGRGGPLGGSFRYISAVDVLAGKLPAASLEGRYALLGFTAPGLMDLRATPVDQAYPGVEVHANLISGILDGRMVVRPAYAGTIEIGALVLTGIVLTLVLPRLRLGGAAMLCTLLAAVLVTLDGVAYRVLHFALPVASIWMLIFGALASSLVLGYGFESRARHALARQFATYIPPELVRAMLRQPGRYDMQARTLELTVMFCDLRGFTSLAETMHPRELQTLLGNVLTRLSQVIHAHQGTIDKYMGDCIMAFWGAPIEMPDHARRAIDAALAIEQEFVAINTSRAAASEPPLSVGIGLGTGLMSVGNMGSDLRRTYTVIGDAVNLASRLEGLSAVYGVSIVAAEATRQHASVSSHPAPYIWQVLDRVRVKGRKQADTIFTVRGANGVLTAELAQELEQWRPVPGLWVEGRFDKVVEISAKLAAEYPQMHLYTLYENRARPLLKNPPEPGWDATAIYDTK